MVSWRAGGGVGGWADLETVLALLRLGLRYRPLYFHRRPKSWL
jgi:hypothetical protein